AAGTSGFYAYTTYMQKFLSGTHGTPAVSNFSKEQATNINLVVLTIFMFAQPLFGILADKFGRKTMLMLSFGVGAIAAYPVFTTLTHTTSYWAAVFWCVLPLLALSG